MSVIWDHACFCLVLLNPFTVKMAGTLGAGSVLCLSFGDPMCSMEPGTKDLLALHKTSLSFLDVAMAFVESCSHYGWNL